MRADTDNWVDTVGDTMTGDLVMTGADIDLGTGNGALLRGTDLFLHSRGTTNTGVGLRALDSTTNGAGNTAVGDSALQTLTGGFGNNAVGHNALQASSGGNWNTAIGQIALFSNTSGSSNTAIGQDALQANGSGNDNTALGEDAMRSNSTGSRNTAVGESALRNGNGSDNVALGVAAGSLLGTGSNHIVIANLGVDGDDGTIRIGSSSQTRTFLAGVSGATTDVNDAVPVMIDSSGQLGTISSSRRFKWDIRDIGERSSRLLELRPVSFRYRAHDGEGSPQFGLIAEEVAEVLPELVVLDREGRPATVKYHLLDALLLNELQRVARQLDELRLGTSPAQCAPR